MAPATSTHGRTAIVGVLRPRGADGRRDEDERAALHPGPLAGGEPRRQEPVVDLARDGEAVELRRGDEETVVRQPAIGEVLEVDLARREDAVALDAVRGAACDLLQRRV